MLKALWLVTLLYVLQTEISAQRSNIIKNKFIDSARLNDVKENTTDELPVIAVNENERSESNVPFVPGLLFASRDVFLSTASFHFSVVRFRMRGYDADLSKTFVNGMHMNNLDDGNTQWNLWSGLNEVSRNTQSVLGLRPGEQDFGGMGNTTGIDMRASKQRAQTQFGYAFSNRSFTHKWSFSKSAGFNKKGWAVSISGNLRVAEEGYVPGTYYNGGSYFIGIDKKLTAAHLLSFVFFGSVVVNGKQGSVLKESVGLAGESYNPYWGYQSGKKRNANVARSHEPVVILTDEYRINNHTSLLTTIGCVMGEKSSTAMDWYDAPDPRPDYYRYLPSYQTDSVLKSDVTQAIKENVQLRQINWDHLYDVNKHSIETLQNANAIMGNAVSGLHSHYILEERVTGIKRLDISSIFNTKLNTVLSFNGGASLQWQQSHYYKKINDLLGGDYFVDWNQFAENDFPDDADAIQNDLNHPNRILYKGDVYGYDYAVNTNKVSGWAQVTGSEKRVDYFVAAELSGIYYFRDGKMKNGLFPFHSFGKSAVNAFSNYAVKAGLTYKINGRKYWYLHAAVMSRAPLFDNVFISPRTSDTQQENIQDEQIGTAETGYVWNAPKIKLRLSAYLTQFRNGMNVMTFYHDGYGNFVNYALSGIDKIHFGTELGVEWKLTSRFTLNAAASVGRYYYNSREHVSVTEDNDASVLEKTIIYSQNFRVGGTPQEAYGLGLAYQSSGTFYMNLSGNYFRQQWLDFNPLRRTYTALENVTPGSDQWDRIVEQINLPDQYTVDLSGGTSMRTRLFFRHRHMLLINASINNLLNKKDLISGGYEQLRFDTDAKNTDKFPPKYFYAMGLNFSINISLRL